ncbi:MAG: type III pantothenate kinase [Lachnospiraceae bacterium]|nr:type III pantothenate kinase [Lachnospiraceae bacterium]
MLLAVDVGNTNITVGLFDDEALCGTFRLTTKQTCTSDEYGFHLKTLMREKFDFLTPIDGCIVSSVVPNIMHSLTSAIIKYFNVRPIIVGPGLKTGIHIKIDNPKELGADKIVDAVAAHEIYGGNLIVIDFGTATTYDLVGEDGTYYSGVIQPGISISAHALSERAAKLPNIELRKPKTIISRNTVEAMQAGVVFGYIGSCRYIIEKLKEEWKMENVRVVATGGLGKIIADELPEISIYDEMLTLKGLQILYAKNR